MPRGRVLARPSDAELTRLRETYCRAPARMPSPFLFYSRSPIRRTKTAVAAALAELGKPLSVSHRFCRSSGNMSARAPSW